MNIRHRVSAAFFVFCAAVLATDAQAEKFNIPSGDLKSALGIYASRTGVDLVYLDDDVKGAKTKGAEGDFSQSDALSRILAGTGFVAHKQSSGAIDILRNEHASLYGLMQRALLCLAPDMWDLREEREGRNLLSQSELRLPAS